MVLMPGGIINIVTKKEKAKPAVTVNMYAGSYYTTQQSANISGGDSSLNYSLTAGQISLIGLFKAAAKMLQHLLTMMAFISGTPRENLNLPL